MSPEVREPPPIAMAHDDTDQGASEEEVAGIQ